MANVCKLHIAPFLGGLIENLAATKASFLIVSFPIFKYEINVFDRGVKRAIDIIWGFEYGLSI